MIAVPTEKKRKYLGSRQYEWGLLVGKIILIKIFLGLFSSQTSANSTPVWMPSTITLQTVLKLKPKSVTLVIHILFPGYTFPVYTSFHSHGRTCAYLRYDICLQSTISDAMWRKVTLIIRANSFTLSIADPTIIHCTNFLIISLTRYQNYSLSIRYHNKFFKTMKCLRLTWWPISMSTKIISTDFPKNIYKEELQEYLG